MSYDLSTGIGCNFTFTVWTYWKLLELALEYGWEPAGTLLVDGPGARLMPVEGVASYLANDHQMVSADDAAELADALERALADFPEDCDIRDCWLVGEGNASSPARTAIDDHRKSMIRQLAPLGFGTGNDIPGPKMRLAHLLSGEGRNWVRKMIRLCNTSGFIIG